MTEAASPVVPEAVPTGRSLVDNDNSPSDADENETLATEDTAPLRHEWQRVLHANGDLFVSSLVRGRSIGDRYLGLLHRSGEIAEPRSPEEFVRAVDGGANAHAPFRSAGNFAVFERQAKRS